MTDYFLLYFILTNVLTYLQSSFARYMSGQGFDTWILEVRGSGLSVWGPTPKKIEQSAEAISDTVKDARSDADCTSTAKQKSRSIPDALAESVISSARGDPTKIPTLWDEPKLVMKLTESFTGLLERLSGSLRESQSKIIPVKFVNHVPKLIESTEKYFNWVSDKLSSLSETRRNSVIAKQIRGLSQKLVNMMEGGQRSVSPRLFELQERFNTTIADFQKQLELIVKYDWDFDHYLEEDVPAAVR